MTQDLIPDDIRRFILTSIPSVPHLEALILLRGNPDQYWDDKAVATRLFIADSAAAKLLEDLVGAGFLIPAADDPSAYRYPSSPSAQTHMVDRVAVTYARNLVEVTSLIHGRSTTRVQQFADAFRIRKE